MKKSQVAQLLVWASGIDGRAVNEASVEAWHRVLGGVNYEAALEAAAEHYQESTFMLKPAHILSRVVVDQETGPLRDASAELQAEQKTAWCLEHGVTVEAYDRAVDRGDTAWLVALGRDEFKAVEHG